MNSKTQLFFVRNYTYRVCLILFLFLQIGLKKFKRKKSLDSVENALMKRQWKLFALKYRI